MIALVGLLAGLAAVFDWFERRLDPPPPGTIDARILDVGLQRTEAPLAGYLRSTKQPLDGLTRAERQEPGLLFSVRVRLRGSTGKRFPLTWTLYDVGRDRPLRSSLYRQLAVTFTPEAATHARTWPIWVPYPPRPGRYRLELVLADGRGQPVDERSSGTVPLDRIPSIG